MDRQEEIPVVFFRQQTDVTEEDIASIEPISNNPTATATHFSLYYNNVRGMTGKKDQILLSSTSTDYDAIVIPETWLNHNKFSAEFFDIRYTVYRKDRQDSNIDAVLGGGVLIAVDSKHDTEEIVFPELIPLEAVCVKVNFHSSKSRMFIYGLYIQYGSGEDVYSSHLTAIIKAHSLIQHGDIFLVAGDFNMSCVKWTSNEDGFDFLPLIGDSTSVPSTIARNFTSTLLEHGLFQLTNLTNDSGNVLDLIYTNMPELALVTKVDLPLITEGQQDKAHVPLHCLIECEPSFCPPSPPSDAVYCFKKAPFDLIREAISNINFDTLFTNKNVDEMVDAFYSTCYGIFDELIPKATLRVNNHPAWYDNTLINLKNRRNRAYQKLLNSRNSNIGPSDDSAFLAAKNEFEAYQDELYNGFLQNLALNYKRQPKKFWNYINSKYKKSTLPATMFYGNDRVSTDIDKANLFAKFFATVYKKHPNEEELDAALLSFINSRNDDGYMNVEVTPDIVRQVLLRIDLSKGVSPDKMAPLFLRECADLLCVPLSAIYAKSLTNLHYPQVWKMGHVTPIHKSGSKADVTNYRGVNVSPNLAKVLEIIVHGQTGFNIYPHISTTQHGFFPGRRVESNLFEFSVLVHDSFDDGNQTDTFYADIHKAFDVICYVLLLFKLAAAKYRLSNRLLLWLRSFFRNRKQAVKINTSLSVIIDVHSGVGQGSIVGPMFFLVFFDDSDDPSSKTVGLNFADDKKIVHNRISSIDDTHLLQETIDDFFNWCQRNGFELNAGKCKIMTLARKKSPILADYHINGNPIKRVYDNKDLGTNYRHDFSFNVHRELASKKGQSMLSFIKRQCYGRFNVDTAKMLYSSVVRSHLEFACPVWLPHHDVHVQTLESVQRQFVLYANHDRRNDLDDDSFRLRPYADRCAELNLQSLARRRVNAAVFFIHDVLTGKVNSPMLRGRITLFDGSRALRNPSLIRLGVQRREYSAFSPFNFACRLFNLAAAHVDPTLSSRDFRHNVLELDDSVFDSYAAC